MPHVESMLHTYTLKEGLNYLFMRDVLQINHYHHHNRQYVDHHVRSVNFLIIVILG